MLLEKYLLAGVERVVVGVDEQAAAVVAAVGEVAERVAVGGDVVELVVVAVGGDLPAGSSCCR